METHLKLDIHGRELDDEMLWDILSYASVNGVMIETASNELEGAPSGNTVREHLTGALDETRAGVVALEAQLNTALLAQLPRHVRKRLRNKRFEVGIDLVGIPYHGQPSQDSNEIRRSRARSGTTHFHTYATLTIVHDNLRYALALTFVWADESLDQVLKRLILRVRALDLRIRRAYLDKGFCSTAVLRLLRRHRIPYIVPIPRWGKKGGGIKALFVGKRSYRTQYTFHAGKPEAYTTDVLVVRREKRERNSRTKIEWFPYAVYRVHQLAPHQVYQHYRRRFGMESGYRQMHTVRARTTSPNPALRLLFIGLALVIYNLYISLRRTWLHKRHYGMRIRYIWLTLKRLALMLLRSIERRLGITDCVQIASSVLTIPAFS